MAQEVAPSPVFPEQDVLLPFQVVLYYHLHEDAALTATAVH